MIRVQLNQQSLHGGQRFSKKRLAEVLRCVEKIIGVRSYEVSIAFVSDIKIKTANKIYRKINKVTDVLSFQLADDQGELLISYDQAKKQAKQMNHSTAHEIGFLIVHGMLHLFGYDHEKSGEAKMMFSQQEKILDLLGIDPRVTYDEP